MTSLQKLIEEVKVSNISLSKDTFAKEVDTLIDKHYFDDDRYSNVESSFSATLLKKLNITSDEEEQLVQLQKLSPFMDDKDSAEKFLPIALYNIRNRKVDYSSLSSANGAELDSSVTYFSESSNATSDFVRENIEFAAQLYYVMVMGDELEMFNAADALITRHLRSKTYSVDIRSKMTLDAIRMYAFGERFENVNTGITYQRTLEAERMMFYKQVFNLGEAVDMPTIDSNPDFSPLWDTLMVEVTNYIAKLENSGYYENISRNNIYQAIEDLQYNLSNNCIGLAKISSNVMNLELNFISKRLFEDKDIKEQIGKRDRTAFGVLKQILLDLNGERGMKMQNILALNNKAILGHMIITDIAKFSPAYIQKDDNFGKFITNVQAYFLAQQTIEKQHLQSSGNGYQGNMPGGGPSLSDLQANLKSQMPTKDEWEF
jgi:hypothetical protein